MKIPTTVKNRPKNGTGSDHQLLNLGCAVVVCFCVSLSERLDLQGCPNLDFCDALFNQLFFLVQITLQSGHHGVFQLVNHLYKSSSSHWCILGAPENPFDTGKWFKDAKLL